MKITHRPSALASADNRRLAATHFISYFHAHATWRLYVKADILVSESKTFKTFLCRNVAQFVFIYDVNAIHAGNRQTSLFRPTLQPNLHPIVILTHRSSGILAQQYQTNSKIISIIQATIYLNVNDVKWNDIHSA